MSSVWIVPGLAVHRYAIPSADALRGNGHDVRLLEPPGWPGRPAELDRYGEALAAEIADTVGRVDLLVGLSVGGQAAAVAAATTPGIPRLLLVSPTIDPDHRTRRALLAGWLRGEDHPDSPGTRTHLPDWRRAGPVRIYRTFASVLTVQLEQILPTVDAAVTIAHADHDQLSSHASVGPDSSSSRTPRTPGRSAITPASADSWTLCSTPTASIGDKILDGGRSTL